MNTHPPTYQTYPKCHSVTIHILWMVHGLGGGMVVEWLESLLCGWCVVGWVVGGFMGWLVRVFMAGCVCGCVGGGGVGGWRVHRVAAYTHPPMKLQYQNI